MRSFKPVDGILRRRSGRGWKIIAGITSLLFLVAAAPSGFAANYKVLYSFNGAPNDGAVPEAKLTFLHGVIYGTTSNGGLYESGGYGGTAFALTPPPSVGGKWTEAVIANFGNPAVSDGFLPQGGLTVGVDGILYGTLFISGTDPYGYGAVFSLSPSPTNGGWIETVLYSFTGPSRDAEGPSGELAFVGGQYLLGTTFRGGTKSVGTIFTLPAAGGPDKILHSFDALSGDGYFPIDGLLYRNNAFFGTTEYGGNSGDCSSGGTTCGTVFQLTRPTATAPGTYAVIYAFHGLDGAQPFAPVISDQNGVLYGTTMSGGNSLAGTVFSLTPPASAGDTWTENVLYQFTGGADGGLPESGLVLGQNGALYGVTNYPGVLYSLAPPSTPGDQWTETVLHTFSDTPDGFLPAGAPILVNGVLYGTTARGGASGNGIVYALQP